MLASIRGKVIGFTDNEAVVECGGFGIEVTVSRGAASKCREGEDVFLYTVMQTSDAGIALYGFADNLERRIFKHLIMTKGVGGRVGITVLQYLTPAEIVSAVMSEDFKILTSVPGIGKKTAERICFEQLDRFKKDGLDVELQEVSPAASESSAVFPGAVDALVGLGFSALDAQRRYDAVMSSRNTFENEGAVIMACLQGLDGTAFK